MAYDAPEYWEKLVEEIKSKSGGAASLQGFLSLVHPVGVLKDSLLLAVPNEFSKNFLDNRLHGVISHFLQVNFPEITSYEVFINPSLSADEDETVESALITSAPDLSILDEEKKEPLEVKPAPVENPATIQTPQPSLKISEKNQQKLERGINQLNQNYSFDSFVVGDSNRFSHAAAFAVAENPALSYNPLFIYGGSGLGKTHLLHAIGNYARELNDQLKVLYVNSEEFTNDFINSIRDDNTESFQKRYRGVDILLIDDIQFLSGKEQTLEEFFHTFNTLHSARKQIVITSDVSPKDLQGFAERLRSRFESGLITDVAPPNLETRTAILRKKAIAENLVVPDDVLSYIADHITNNIRELEGSLLKVTAFASLNNQAPSLDIAKLVLKDLVVDNQNFITPEIIIARTADYFAITVESLRSTNRTQEISYARQVAMYLCREITDLSLPRIGQLFGRDHTTVIYATKKITNQFYRSSKTLNQIQELTSKIKRDSAGLN